MKDKYFILSAAIAAALSIGPSMATSATGVLAGFNTNEAPRVTQTIDSSNLVTIPKTHLAFLAQAESSFPIPDAVVMHHLQLILKPSANRQAAMEQLIANQHNPKSAEFDHWITPQQFGDAFGVGSSDIATVSSWLTAQGFTVNFVYPNKAQIDFTGTAAQVSAAFHTQESIYKFSDGSQHLANAEDIRIPSALRRVVAGVMGLTDIHEQSEALKPHIVKWSAANKGFVPKTSSDASSKPGFGQAVSYDGGTERGLVPNDMATMYGIRTIRNNGVTGKGVTIAVVENDDMVPSDWNNFVSTFNLGTYGGTFKQINPAPPTGTENNCVDPNAISSILYGPGTQDDSQETLLDAEWATAIAPGANVEVAACDNDSALTIIYNDPSTGVIVYQPTIASTNFFGGTYLAALNLVNGNSRPDIISASYGFGEFFVDSASKTAIDLMWAQADAEGISVFVASGDSGSNPSFNGYVMNGVAGNTAVDANALATSPHVTAVGGTDLADVLDGTTSQYFAPAPSVVGGSALSYVPEIPWNSSCGNGVAAKAFGYSSAIAFCKGEAELDPQGLLNTSEGASGGPSSVDAKPVWQREIYNAARDQSRDIPDVSLFAASFGEHTLAITCTHAYPCTPDFTHYTALTGGTSLSSPMFAGIQALVDQGLAARGMAQDQGNAAPMLYALAEEEYGNSAGPVPASLAACSADNGTKGTAGCVFHNITRGSISTQCEGLVALGVITIPISNCYMYETVGQAFQYGLTTTDAAPTSYSPSNKAFGAQPGWSFASGLGSVNATNLLMAWRAFVNAPPAASASN